MESQPESLTSMAVWEGKVAWITEIISARLACRSTKFTSTVNRKPAGKFDFCGGMGRKVAWITKISPVSKKRMQEPRMGKTCQINGSANLFKFVQIWPALDQIWPALKKAGVSPFWGSLGDWWSRNQIICSKTMAQKKEMLWIVTRRVK